MAHELDQTTGRAAVMVAGEAPWHRLGVNVAQTQTSDSAIKLAGLDWDVVQCSMTATRLVDVANGMEERLIDVPGHVANIRSDTHAVLGVVGDGYRPFQNREAFDFMDTIVGEKLAIYETAGSLRGGKHVWMMVRLPDDITVGQDDVSHSYMLLTNSHDGSRALRVIPTSVRVVCMNTLNLALSRGEGKGIKIRHSESLAGRVYEARRALRLVSQRFAGMQQEVDSLAKRKLTQDELANYFAMLMCDRAAKPERQKELVRQLVANLEHPTNTVGGMEGSAWAAFNAVSYYADHQTKVLGKGLKADDNRLNSIWFGSAHDLKTAAYNAALALASA